jgi:hypothetical protein
MIFLRAPEGRRRLDLRHDRALEPAALLDFFLCSLGCDFLRWRMIKNDGAILRPHIRPLSVQCRRIVIRPENVEQLIVIDLCRIELDLHDFGVTGLVGANIFIAWVPRRPAGITDRRGGNAFEFAKSFFDSPKTSRAERCFLRRHAVTMKREWFGRNTCSGRL